MKRRKQSTNYSDLISYPLLYRLNFPTHVILALILSILFLLLPVSQLSAQEIINLRSGQLFLTHTDLALPAGSINLTIQRTLIPHETKTGLLGLRWGLNWEKNLSRVESIVFIREATGTVSFTQKDISETYLSISGEKIIFDKDGGAVRTKPDLTKEKYDAKGRLIEMGYHNGNKFKLHYNNKGLLSQVDDSRGNFIKFIVDMNRKVTRIESSKGDIINYLYSGENLTQIQVNGGPLIQYTYNAKGTLIKIDNPASGPVELEYDSKGRVLKRRFADNSQERYEYDNVNQIYRRIDPNGETTTIRLIQNGRKEETTDPLGNLIVTEYNDYGLPVLIIDHTGATSRISYDTLGRTISVEECCGQITRYEYLGDTLLLKNITYPDGSRQIFDYDNNQNLIAIKEGEETVIAISYYPDGLTASYKKKGEAERKFSYYQDGRLQSETNPLGEVILFEYDNRGNKVREISPMGNVTVYKYDKQNRLVSMTDPAEVTTRFIYDTKGNLVQIIDPAGGITKYNYDIRGRVTAKTDPAGHITRYQYSASGLLSSVTAPDRGEYRFQYDTSGNLIREINPLGGITTRTYNSRGRIIKITDPVGSVWQYDYSPDGSLTRTIDPTGYITQYHYDSKGRREGITDPAGHTTRYEYDSRGQATKTILPDGLARIYNYDQSGNLVSETDNRGRANHYEYDVIGRLVRERKSTGLEYFYNYDADGNLIGMRNNLGNGLTMQYDRMGLVTAMINPTGVTTRYSYDLVGRLTEEINPLGYAKRMVYSLDGNLAKVTEPSGDTAKYEYDIMERLSAINHPSGGVSRFTHDSIGNILTVTNPNGAKIKNVYDVAGRLVSSTDGNRQTTNFTYDSSGRLTKKQFSNGKVVNYKYDTRGRLVELDDGVYPVKYFYNSIDRLTQIEYPAIKKTLRYEYDKTGLLTKFVDSDSNETQYEYDVSGNLSSIKLSDNKAITFTYDAKSRLTSVIYPNGIKGTWEYANIDRPSQITYSNKTGEIISRWDYEYNPIGNLVKTVDIEGRVSQYAYDNSGRLIEENYPTGSIKYSYLPGGNRGRREIGGIAIQYEYNHADQLIKTSEETFKYDGNGNLIEKKGSYGLTQYIYDIDNNLVKVILPDGSDVSFGYSPTGERIWRRDKRGKTYFVTDGINLIAELREDLKTKVSYLHGTGIDRPLMMQMEGQNYFYNAKLLGSIATLSDSEGKVLAHYETDAFGNLINRINTINTLPNPFIFTGREYEPDIGLYYHHARYYDPQIGRFLSVDPIPGRLEEPLELNPYLYARNNPLLFVDPLGTRPNVPSIEYVNFQDPSTLGKFDPPDKVLLSKRLQSHPVLEKAVISHELQGHGRQFQSRMDLLYGKNQPRPEINIQRSEWANYYSKNKGRLEASAYARQLEVLREQGVPERHDYIQKTKIEYNRALVQEHLEEQLRQQRLRSMGKPPTPQVTGTNVALGVSGVVGVASIIANHKACLDEGKSQTDCAKETAVIIGVAIAAGTITVLAIPAIAAALGISVAVITTAGAIVAVPAALYGAYRAGGRWAEAPVIKAENMLRQQQKELLVRFGELVKGVQSDIGKLNELRVVSVGLCQQVNQQAQLADQLAGSSKTLMGQLKGLIPSIKQGFSQCNESPGIIAEIESLLSKSKENEDKVIKNLEWALGRAVTCNKKEDANKILEIYNNCINLAARIQVYSAIAKGKNNKLSKIKTDVNKAMASLGNAEETKDKIRSNMAQINNIASSYISNFEKLKSLSTMFITQRASLVERINHLGNLLPDEPPHEIYKKEFEDAYNKVALLKNSINDIPGISDCPLGRLDHGYVVRIKLDIENIFSAAENLFITARNLSNACNVTTLDNEVEEIKDSANSALGFLHIARDLPQKADACLARLGDKDARDRISRLRNTETNPNKPKGKDSTTGSIPDVNVTDSYDKGRTTRSGQDSQQAQGTAGATQAERTTASQAQDERDKGNINAQGQATGSAITQSQREHATTQQTAQQERQNSLGTTVARGVAGGLTSGVATGLDSGFGTLGRGAGQQSSRDLGAQPNTPSQVSSSSSGSQTSQGGSGTQVIACSSTAKSGKNAPETVAVNVGKGSGTVQFFYNMHPVKDQMIVSYGGQTLYDTGCVSGSKTVPLFISGTSEQVIITVRPACAGSTTRWDLRLDCPKP